MATTGRHFVPGKNASCDTSDIASSIIIKRSDKIFKHSRKNTLVTNGHKIG